MKQRHVERTVKEERGTLRANALVKEWRMKLRSGIVDIKRAVRHGVDSLAALIEHRSK